MRVGVASIAAVRVRSVTVGLDLGCRGADEARRSSIELTKRLASSSMPVFGTMGTHPAGRAGTDIVREAIDVCWCPLQDDGLDLVDSTGGDGDRSVCHSLIWIAAATESIVEDFGSLCHLGQPLVYIKTLQTSHT